MRVESLEVFPATRACYLRVRAEDGTCGVGESTYFGWPEAVADIARSFAPYLVGRDPFDTEQHFLALYRALCFRGMAVTGALSALDQALWDLKGKHFEVPVWQLLGGRARKAVRAMRVLRTGTLDEVVEAARVAVDVEGYTAIKVLLFQHEHHGMRQAQALADLVARFAAIRETVGWQIDLGVELHRNMTAGDALMLCEELVRFRPLFVEDPIPPDSVVALRAFAARSPIPVAAGERNTTIWEFAEYLERPGVAYARPDVGIAGGITHVHKILRPRRGRSCRGVAPRRPFGPRRHGRPRPAGHVHTQLGVARALTPGRSPLDRPRRPRHRAPGRLPPGARAPWPRRRARR